MSKISKEVANKTAVKIAEKLQKKVTEARIKMEQKITEIFKKKVPKAVLEFYEKYPEYTNTTKQFYASTYGFNYKYLSFSEHVPSNAKLTWTEKEAGEVKRLEMIMEDLREKYKKTVQEIENTILALGTYKRVQEQCPDIYKYLPQLSGNTGLMLNVAPINTKVKCLISEDDKCIDKI